MEIGHRVFMFFPPFLFALCFHEWAHGMVAKWKGDRTADMMGRLTLNPLAHGDMWGTLVLPIMAIVFGFPFFGWAKPVPVDSRNFKHPERDMFWVSLAGPASNIFLAIIAGLLLLPGVAKFMGEEHGTGGAFTAMGKNFLVINLFLAFFNLIPLHPLDGGKILAPFLPKSVNGWLEENQGMLSWALIIVFLLGGFQFLVAPVDWASVYLYVTGMRLWHL